MFQDALVGKHWEIKIFLQQLIRHSRTSVNTHFIKISPALCLNILFLEKLHVLFLSPVFNKSPSVHDVACFAEIVNCF